MFENKSWYRLSIDPDTTPYERVELQNNVPDATIEVETVFVRDTDISYIRCAS